MNVQAADSYSLFLSFHIQMDGLPAASTRDSDTATVVEGLDCL